MYLSLNCISGFCLYGCQKLPDGGKSKFDSVGVESYLRRGISG